LWWYIRETWWQLPLYKCTKVSKPSSNSPDHIIPRRRHDGQSIFRNATYLPQTLSLSCQKRFPKIPYSKGTNTNLIWITKLKWRNAGSRNS
jgi:hypothetical protein